MCAIRIWHGQSAVAFWKIPVAAALIWLGFSDTGWTAYLPYSIIKAAGPATDMWIFGMKILGISSILGSVNFIVTILKMKHPDLPIMKMSLFAWGILGSILYDNSFHADIFSCHDYDVY
jgi:cytochrome c oxidase subunit I